jgi:hypothetical protein
MNTVEKIVILKLMLRRLERKIPEAVRDEFDRDLSIRIDAILDEMEREGVENEKPH